MQEGYTKVKKKLGIILWAILMIVATTVCAEETIRITNGEWPPYLSEKLDHYGYGSRIVTEAFAKEGIPVKYSFFPWKRAYEMAKQGSWDATLLWVVTDERKPFFDASDPILEEQDVFFHLKSFDFDWETIDDLKDIQIGATLGYVYGDLFQKAEKDGSIQVERVRKDEINFKKLLGKRISVFVCSFSVGYALLNKMYNSETVALFTNHPKAVKETSYHLLFSKEVPENKDRLVKFNSGLKMLKESGEFDRFIEEGRAH